MQSWLRTTNLIIPFQHLFSVFLPLLSLPRPALGGFCRMRDSRGSNAFISQRGHQVLRHLCVVPRTASPHTPNHSIRKDLKAHLIQGCEWDSSSSQLCWTRSHSLGHYIEKILNRTCGGKIPSSVITASQETGERNGGTETGHLSSFKKFPHLAYGKKRAREKK